MLTEVNNIIHQDNESTMFITLIYATYNPNSGLLTYANGGHCPPLLVQPDGECVELPTNRGIALGLIPSRDYGEMSVTIPPARRVPVTTAIPASGAITRCWPGLGLLGSASGMC